MNDALTIRLSTESDRSAIRALFVELQDHEHALSPEAPTGEEVVDEYLGWMVERCRAEDGMIGIAELGGEPVGFVTVLCSVQRTDPDDPVPVHAYISELSVSGRHRGSGIGSALLRWGEQQARAAGRDELRIGAVALNTGARRLYERTGFEPSHIIYSKPLID